ncbi:hypothetical protein [Pseudomonas abyssi]|uniref:hypothetical protein n=1 Tax=Pseudomonas abyssi TaxID=170540 RepID=UPI003C7CB9A0
MRTLLLSLLCLTLAACATRNIEPGYALGRDEGKGLAVGSITYLGGYSGYSIYYRSVATQQQGRFQTGSGQLLAPSFSDKDFSGADGAGRLIAAELEAGEYEIFLWQVASGAATVSPDAPFSIRFKVSPGEIVYFGNFNFEQTASFGLTVTGAAVSFNDRAERDIGLFRQKYPNLAEFDVTAAIEPGASYDNLGGLSSARWDIPVIVPVQ